MLWNTMYIGGSFLLYWCPCLNQYNNDLPYYVFFLIFYTVPIRLILHLIGNTATILRLRECSLFTWGGGVGKLELGRRKLHTPPPLRRTLPNTIKPNSCKASNQTAWLHSVKLTGGQNPYPNQAVWLYGKSCNWWADSLSNPVLASDQIYNDRYVILFTLIILSPWSPKIKVWQLQVHFTWSSSFYYVRLLLGLTSIDESTSLTWLLIWKLILMAVHWPLCLMTHYPNLKVQSYMYKLMHIQFYKH